MAFKPESYPPPRVADFVKDGMNNPLWIRWLENIFSITDGLESFTVVSATDITGTDQAIDEIYITKGNVAFYFYMIKNDENIRCGFIYFPWYTTTLPTRPGAQDIEIGDTDDFYFSTALSSDSLKITLQATCTETYTFKALRIIL